jgi:diguanylate cyclase (GGDEF)-like protein/putative nucleotidyltransferase with HDIG domain
MPPQASFVAFSTIAFGSGALVWALTHWQTRDLGAFLALLAVATAAAALRIKLPNVRGVLSLHTFFVLVCISRMTLPETILIATAGAIFQCAVFVKAPAVPLAPVLDIAVSACAAAAAYLTYHGLGFGASPLFLILAGCVFFVVSTLPYAVLASLTEHKQFARLWRESYFWAFPPYVAAGGAAGLLAMLDRGAVWESMLLILPIIYWMYHSYRFYLQGLDEERRRVRDLSDLHFRTIEALALAIEGHDPSKNSHLRRVGLYVTEVGKQLGLPESELDALRAAAMLHDIGKLAVPEHIITKPGRLTEAEFERVKVHPTAGAEILEQVRFPYPVAPIVRSHHEKWDGSGYPAGLKGTDIPLGARILAAVDCLDALLSERYHRRALSLDKAIQHIKAESGRSYDPQVVSILVSRCADLEERIRLEQRQARPLLVHEAPAAPRGFLTRIAAARKEQQQLFQLARELGNSLSLDETLPACALRIKAMCPYNSIAVFVRRGERLQAEYASGDRSWELGALHFPLGRGLVGRVAESRNPILNGHPAEEPGLPQTAGLRSALVLPLEGSSEVVGVMALYAHQEDAFTVDHMRVLSAVCAKTAVAIENAVKYSQAEQSATTDVLTGLANSRSLFLQLDNELARARRNGNPVAVLVCDLDGFKQINDRFGHMEGNRVLRDVAQALKRQCRETDFVARMGGDEFVIVLPAHRADTLPAKIDQLRQAASAAGASPDGRFAVGLSVGEAFFPEDGDNAEALLAAADRRMYEMKEKGGQARRGDTLGRLSAALGSGSGVQ